MLGLLIRKGAGSGSFVPLEARTGRYSLGRSEDATIQIEGEGISRQHAEIVYAGGRWVLRDLKSRNGTYLNSLLVREHELAPRDVIVVGTVELLVVSRDPVDEPCGEALPDDGSRTLPLAVAPILGIVGDAAPTQAVLDAIRRVAPLDVTVVLRGESGTGKELVARAIHSASARRSRAFVAVNCGAIPEALLESELFGHEKGAFTGATSRRAGRFQDADGGTLFLDEIGELPAAAQVSLLRVLEDGVVRRVGGTRDERVDVRVVAATHRNLTSEIQSGRFRNDLYHRLNVFEIVLPPLRERLGDLPLLVRHFLDGLAPEIGRDRLALSDDTMRLLRGHTWPGNVRELRNVLERAAIRTDGELIHATTIEITPPAETEVRGAADPGAPSAPADESLAGHLSRHEATMILAALEAAGWNQSEAARRLGVSESKIRKAIREHGLKRIAPK